MWGAGEARHVRLPARSIRSLQTSRDPTSHAEYFWHEEVSARREDGDSVNGSDGSASSSRKRPRVQ
jgi:hypothetical protein